MPRCGRSWLEYSTKASSASWRSSSLASGRRYRHSRRTVWNQRSTFPFVWGRYGRVRRAPTPRSAHDAFHTAGTYGLPLSVSTRCTGAAPGPRGHGSAPPSGAGTRRPSPRARRGAVPRTPRASRHRWRRGSPSIPPRGTPGDRPADDASEFLRVDVDQVARHPGPAETQSHERPMDGGTGHSQHEGNPVGTPAPRDPDAGDRLRLRRGERHPGAPGPAGPVRQAGQSLGGEPLPPAGVRRPRDAGLGARIGHRRPRRDCVQPPCAVNLACG